MEENGENNYTLTIDNIKERNLGNYTCQAVNKIGDGSSTIALKGNLRLYQYTKNWINHQIFISTILSNIIIIFSGIPFDLTFHSSSTGRYKTHYNLSWTLKSFVPIQKTELQYKTKVSNVLYSLNMLSIIISFNYQNI